jgi:hypothetical protein
MLAVSLMGCRPADKTLPFTPSPAPVPIGTVTPAAIPTKPPTSTPHPQNIYASARDLPVNCRFGPGTIYEVVDGLEPYQAALVVGRDYTDQWWYLHNPNNPGAMCWVSASATDLEGDDEFLPVVDPPFVTVDKLKVRAEPPRVTVQCDAFPQYVLLVAEISTNGPALVTWHWELGTGEVTQTATLIFERADTQVVQKSVVMYGPNDYWGQLRIDAPNEIVTQVKFIANCTQ